MALSNYYAKIKYYNSDKEIDFPLFIIGKSRTTYLRDVITSKIYLPVLSLAYLSQDLLTLYPLNRIEGTIYSNYFGLDLTTIVGFNNASGSMYVYTKDNNPSDTKECFLHTGNSNTELVYRDSNFPRCFTLAVDTTSSTSPPEIREFDFKMDSTYWNIEVVRLPTNKNYGIISIEPKPNISELNTVLYFEKLNRSSLRVLISADPYDPSVNPDAPPTPVTPDAPEPKPPKPPEGDTLPRATFYKNISDKEHVTKDITEIVSYDITFKEPTDILNPTIKISGSDIDTIIQQSNYMYIDKLKRYYYITGMRIVRSGLIEVTGHVDVLMSFNAEIRNQKAIIKRQANSYNLLLDDNNFQFQANPIIKTQTFPQNFHDLQYILSVIK